MRFWEGAATAPWTLQGSPLPPDSRLDSPMCTSVEPGAIHSPAGSSRLRERLWAPQPHPHGKARRSRTEGPDPPPQARAPGPARASHGQLKAFQF